MPETPLQAAPTDVRHPAVYSIKRHGTGVERCDDEPVRTPGCVQAHGVLLVLRPGELTIAQASENTADHFGRAAGTLLGRPVSDLIGDEAMARVRAVLAGGVSERNPLYAGSVLPAGSPPGPPFDLVVHTADGGRSILVEFERTDRSAEGAAGGTDVNLYTAVKRTVARLQAAATIADFCQAAADEVRAVTHLDRVMVYRFHPDGSGEVMAEARRDDFASWIGLRYPAHDIPEPARDVFRRVWVRPLPDATGGLAEMVPLADPETGRPVDMTHCALRGASVMYTEYLANMRVAASLTLAVRRDDHLWGLIACHHGTPTRFPYEVRAACEFLAQVVSVQIRGAEDREHRVYRQRMDAVHHALLTRTAVDGGLSSLTDPNPSLLDGLDAGGVAVLHRGQWWTAGRTPDEEQLHELAGWLMHRPEFDAQSRPALATDALPALFPAAAAYAAVGAGLIAVPISRGNANFVCWFRPEVARTVDWAGDPLDLPTVAGPNGPRLTPRSSFALWRETVAGRATPWLDVEVDAALRLRLMVMDLVVSRAEQLAAMNADLTRSNEELDAFAYVASHDLKEPLRGIHKYGHYLLAEARSGLPMSEKNRERVESLLRLTERMDGLLDALLHFSRVGRIGPHVEDGVPLGELARESFEMLGARMNEPGVRVEVPRPLPTVRCDRVRVREVFSNLIANALKYNDRPAKHVEVGYVAVGEAGPAVAVALAAEAGVDAFYVKDNGIGIAERHREAVFRMFKRLHPREAYGGGSGAGLTIVKKLVEQHGGTIRLDGAPGVGSTFAFTLCPPAGGLERPLQITLGTPWKRE